MRVSAITEAQRQMYLRDIGESWFCAYFNPGSPDNCDGLAEIRIESGLGGRKTVALCLCRTCASDLGAMLADAVEMTDLVDRARWSP